MSTEKTTPTTSPKAPASDKVEAQASDKAPPSEIDQAQLQDGVPALSGNLEEAYQQIQTLWAELDGSRKTNLRTARMLGTWWPKAYKAQKKLTPTITIDGKTKKLTDRVFLRIKFDQGYVQAYKYRDIAEYWGDSHDGRKVSLCPTITEAARVAAQIKYARQVRAGLKKQGAVGGYSVVFFDKEHPVTVKAWMQEMCEGLGRKPGEVLYLIVEQYYQGYLEHKAKQQAPAA